MPSSPALPRLLVLALVPAACSCRVEPPPGSQPTDDTGAVAVVDLGELPLGGSLAVVLPQEDASRLGAEPEVVDGPFEATTWTERGGLLVTLDPEAEGVAAGRLRLADGSLLDLEALVVAASAHWPAPLAVEIGIEALAQRPETGLGQAELAGTGSVPVAEDPVSGNLFIGDAVQGRAWRLDPFYRHPTMGLWVSPDRGDRERWDTPPPCFEDSMGLTQTGTCTGEERDSDGGIPAGWRYFHGGFAGNEDPGSPALAGLVSFVADPGRGRLWVTLPGAVEAVDIGIDLAPEEDGDVYLYTQRLPGLRHELGEGWARPWAAPVPLDAGGLLLLVDLDTGRLGRLDPDGGALTELGSLDLGGGSLDALVHDGQALLARTGDRLLRVDPQTGGTLEEWALPAGALEGLDRGVGEDGGAWLAGGGLLLARPEGEADPRLVVAPDGGTIVDVALDVVSGGTAEPLEILYVVGETGGKGWLRAATPEGAWLGELVQLPAVPRALAHARTAHDLHVIYPAGSDGCDGELARFCTEGSHPALVHSLYNPYSLVPPTSAGHPLNLFLYPIVETPKDGDVDTDWTQSGVCSEAETELGRGCCSLEWSMNERLEPNAAYLHETLGVLGADTPDDPDDDPTFAWGLNNNVLRQAIACLQSESPTHQEIGAGAISRLAALRGERRELTQWTHTAAALGLDATGNHRAYLSLLYEEGVDYELPVDSAEEYALLHEGIAASYVPAAWAEEPELAELDLSGLLCSGNALDAEELVDPELGWPDEASWLVPIRDAPLATGGAPCAAYTFLALGADPVVGSDTFRKKELWPHDIRDRAALAWLPEHALDFPAEVGAASAGSGVVNLPGMSWELGTLRGMSEAGAYRETLKYGQTVGEDNWENVLRMLRRLIASSEAEDVKSWYQHIFDMTHRSGLYTANSGVTDEVDGNVAALERIRVELVEPGYARWATPSEILAEWEQAEASE